MQNSCHLQRTIDFLGFFISLAPANLVDVVGLNNLNNVYGIATTFAGAAILVSSHSMVSIFIHELLSLFPRDYLYIHIEISATHSNALLHRNE